MVSFMDRLMECIVEKIKKFCTLGSSIRNGIKNQEEYLMGTLYFAKGIVSKFKEGFFI